MVEATAVHLLNTNRFWISQLMDTLPFDRMTKRFRMAPLLPPDYSTTGPAMNFKITQQREGKRYEVMSYKKSDNYSAPYRRVLVFGERENGIEDLLTQLEIFSDLSFANIHIGDVSELRGLIEGYVKSFPDQIFTESTTHFKSDETGYTLLCRGYPLDMSVDLKPNEDPTDRFHILFKGREERVLERPNGYVPIAVAKAALSPFVIQN